MSSLSQLLTPLFFFPRVFRNARRSVRESAGWAARSGVSLFFRRVLFWKKRSSTKRPQLWMAWSGWMQGTVIFLINFFMNSCWTRELCAMGFAEIWGLYNSRGLSLFLRVRVDFVRAGHTRKCPLLFQMGASMCSDLFISFYFLSWHKTTTPLHPSPFFLILPFTHLQNML